MCTSCGADIEPRALRCAKCGVPFRGKQAVSQVTVTPREGAAVGFDIEELLLDEQDDAE